MPIYMDRHYVPGITLEDATEAHKLDVAIQDDFDCKAITFWLDEDRGCAFCLVEAPNAKAVKEMHNEAHGLIPHEIMEVDQSLVMAFLGRINEPQVERGKSGGEERLLYDPAYRAILVSRLADAGLIPYKYGRSKGRDFFHSYRNTVEKAYNEFQGRKVRHSGDGYMVSFASVSDALHCAAEIQKQLDEMKHDSEGHPSMAIGISGGDPVTGEKDFFGEAIQLAERLCYLSSENNQIFISSEISDGYGANRLRNLTESTAVRSLSAAEEHFFNRLMDVVEDIWQRPELKLEDICKQVGISRSQLYRKITSLTDRSFVDFLKELRLKRALKLIQKSKLSITQVAYGTGFNNPSYFSKCFKERFGMLPSEYARAVQ